MSDFTTADALTANAGDGAKGAPLLTADLTRVSVIAFDRDSVRLPLAAVGGFKLVANDDPANTLRVLTSGRDTIDLLNGHAVGVEIPPRKRRLFSATATGNWTSLLGA